MQTSTLRAPLQHTTSKFLPVRALVLSLGLLLPTAEADDLGTILDGSAGAAAGAAVGQSVGGKNGAIVR